MFYAGQLVECIDATEEPDGDADALIHGAVYVIADINPERLDGEYGVRVKGVECRGSFFCAPWFRASRFRPLVERKTSIEIFTRMLTPNKQGVDA